MRTHAMRAGLALMLAALVLQLAGTPALAKDGDFFYTFETLDGWKTASDPGVVSTLGLQRDDSGNNDNVGGGLATLKSTYHSFVPGPQAAWTMTQVDLMPGEHAVFVSWYARNQAGCGGCVPTVYVGMTPPASSAQFVAVAPALGKGWQPYEYATRVVAVGDTTTVYVALGWAGTNATIGLDSVHIKFSPILPAGQSGAQGVEARHPGPIPMDLAPGGAQQPANVAGGMRPSNNERPATVAGGMRPSDDQPGNPEADDMRFAN